MAQVELQARIDYPEAQAGQPLLYPLGRQWDVRINIRGASITETGGYLEVELQGEDRDVRAVIEALRESGCDVDADL